MLSGMSKLLPLLLLTSSLTAATVQPPPPTYVCQRATGDITIDGKGEELCWQQAMALSPLRDIEGSDIAHATDIRMLWNNQYLYVLADMKEQHLWATLTKRDSVIYHEPDFEVFIDSEGSGNNYIELEINALNTVWDLFLTAPYRSSHHALHDWNIPGLKHAVHLRGTLNNASDTDEGWSVELAIPWSSITAHSNQPRHTAPPAPGSTLRMNFSRVNWQVSPDASSACGYRKQQDTQGHPLPESNHVWAPTGIINIHYPEFWGYVRLSDKAAGSGYEGMVAPATDSAQRRLYALFNEQLRHKALHGTYSSALQASQVENLYISPERFIIGTTATDGSRLTLDNNGKLSCSAPDAPRPPLYLWVQGGKQEGNTPWWQQHFARLAEIGIHAVIIGGSHAQIAHLTPIAVEQGLQVYAWLWALNRPQDPTALQHPDWYAVNREGKSCHTAPNRPYVKYYQFLCPGHNEVREHLLQQIDKLAAIPGLSGIQLDYMRLPDVILPRGLWGKYGLVMDREWPQFDYCYCERCRQAFRTNSGRDIAPAAEKDKDWHLFRLQQVAHLANVLCERIRRHHLKAACAVFPTPHISSSLVRQNWALFNLDLALPMTYHNYYQENLNWIAQCTRQAAAQSDRRIPLAPGLHLPDMTAETLRETLEMLRPCSPSGIGLFCDDDLTPELEQELRRRRQATPAP